MASKEVCSLSNSAASMVSPGARVICATEDHHARRPQTTGSTRKRYIKQANKENVRAIGNSAEPKYRLLQVGNCLETLILSDQCVCAAVMCLGIVRLDGENL